MGAHGAGDNGHNSGSAYLFELRNDVSKSVQIMGTSYRNGSVTLTFSDEAGVTDWDVMGSRDLVSFTIDKTADSAITEINPGEYQAVVDVSDEPETFFLRIQR